MRSRDILEYALNNLKRNKKRAFLTFLGVMIGVAAIVSVQSLGNGFQIGMRTEIAESFGAKRITVSPQEDTQLNNTILTDIQEMQHVKRATGQLMVQGQVKKLNTNESMTLTVTGTNLTTYNKIDPNFEVAEGKIPANGGNILLLNYAAQHPSENETFAEVGDEFNLTIWQKGSTFTIPLTLEGTLNETSEMGQGMRENGGNGGNEHAYIPLNLLQDTLSTEDLNSITCQADNTDTVDKVANEIRKRYERVQVTTSQKLITQVNDIMGQFTTFLTAISAIALVVAGFGVMNIMLVSVSERTREIGVLKSIGATKRSILGIFLAEAFIIGIAGGIVGVVAGHGGAFLLGRLLASLMGGQSPGNLAEMLVPILDPFTVIIGFLIAVGVSLFFALWPAKRAADKDPVEALRFG